MNASTQRLCAWCGIGCTIGWVVGFFWLAGFLPPPSPSDSAEEIARVFSENTVGIRLGMIVMMFGSVLYLPWSVGISMQMMRIEGEGKNAPMSYTQMLMGAIFVWVFLLGDYTWQAAAFRPDETPAVVTQRLNDLAWIFFINPVATIFVQGMAIGVVILQDRRAQPIFPRWAGWYNIWAVIVYLPGALIPMFKSGPFAWNGLLALWVPVFVFVAWMLGMTVFMLKAISRQEAEERALAPR